MVSVIRLIDCCGAKIEALKEDEKKKRREQFEVTHHNSKPYNLWA